MFEIYEDNSIYVTRGDIIFFAVSAEDDGKPYKFQPGDVLRMKVYGKKNAENVVLQKDFPVTEVCEEAEIFLTEEDTKIGEIISKPATYWYEVELNPYDNPQTIIGYSEDGPALFVLYPEGDDVPEYDPQPEEIPVVDEELDMASTRPIQNQAVARAFKNLEAGYEATHAAVAELHVTPQMHGAIGDGKADDTESLQAALNTKKKLYLPSGVYKVTAPLTAYNDVVFEKDAYIEFYPGGPAKACLKISGSLGRLATGIDCSFAGNILTVGENLPLSAGDYVYLSNDELAAPTCRSFDTKRDILQVHSVDGGVITFTSAPEHSYANASIDKMNTVDNIVVDGAKIRCIGKYSDSYGIVLEYAKNATVRNCHVSGFDYAQINLNFCVFCDVHSNLCEVDYAEELQYGIVVHSSANVTVYGNKANSRRTAIDVTRLSNKVSVTGNTVTGSINTHSCTNTSITNNTINDGMILIRGKNCIVSGNTVSCLKRSCIDIEEMGIEGGHVISNNIFKGYCSMKCYQSNITISGNHFIVEKVLAYTANSVNYESVIRMMTAGTPSKMDGVVISGNTFETVGITPLYCIEANANMQTISNMVVQDNIIRSFKTALYLPQITDTVGDNLIVKNNMLYVTDMGIVFRFVNNTQIVGNTVIGTTKGSTGISRHPCETAETVGLIIRDNFVKNFSYGVRINGGADMKKAVYMDNVYQNCDANSSGVSGNTTRVGNELFATSPNGSIYQLKVDNQGVLTTVATGY
jgi:hypothetical protein